MMIAIGLPPSSMTARKLKLEEALPGAIILQQSHELVADCRNVQGMNITEVLAVIKGLREISSFVKL